MGIKRICSLTIIGLVMTTGIINTDACSVFNEDGKIYESYSDHTPIRLHGTATIKLYDYENTFLVHDIDNWNGTQLDRSKATHAIIPLHEYCSPNYREYNAIQIGVLTIMDEYSNPMEVPLYKEIILDSHRLY